MCVCGSPRLQINIFSNLGRYSHADSLRVLPGVKIFISEIFTFYTNTMENTIESLGILFMTLTARGH